MMTYQVQSPIRYKGKTIKTGLVKMPEYEATVLLKQGVIVEQSDSIEVKAEGKTATPSKTASKVAKQ
ncbi:hypothetical protein [Oligella urethralis]|uniref:hypothetical protein n=1 Tax=Oligella urethralis TaxID=90245 RepID=UPI00288C02C7|nr:hypothetical protein [Oligella urethralis]